MNNQPRLRRTMPSRPTTRTSSSIHCGDEHGLEESQASRNACYRALPFTRSASKQGFYVALAVQHVHDFYIPSERREKITYCPTGMLRYPVELLGKNPYAAADIAPDSENIAARWSAQAIGRYWLDLLRDARASRFNSIANCGSSSQE
ncbi:MAG: hypothetical protein ACR2JE_10915 [Acidobacteriaceae bacterium]